MWAPCTRVFEVLGFHNHRQRFFLGYLNSIYDKNSFEIRLRQKGFETPPLAWRDPGELFSLRKIDNGIFQYHIRLFVDGEIRAHYEYSPESHPFDHFWEIGFEPKTDFFKNFLGDCLIGDDN